MLTLTDRRALRLAVHDPTLDPAVRAVLALRLGQLDGDEAATFHVAGAGDNLVDAEAVVGWPLTMDGEPQWEWALCHPGGITELAFVLSDDGPAEVLLVPDRPGVGAALLELCRQHA